MKKTKFFFTETEWRYIIHSLNALKTKLHNEGQFTDTVDEVMYKFMNAKTKRIKIKQPSGILAEG
ncbi:MAG: hypothetical protein PHR14_09940 [Oscillospiraceae bacterium]|nr:hypothetical protein [Oscillospiraceae bacterium]